MCKKIMDFKSLDEEMEFWNTHDATEFEVKEMIKILLIFGTRPEAIKMAPVIEELCKHPNEMICRVCVTGQHRQMLDQVLALFDIKPDYDLNVMRENQGLGYLTATMLTKLEEIVEKENPDWILVQGDTTTAMVGSLVGFYQQVKIGHVESGLRTWNKYSPYPEEINRKMADILADLHFAPTEQAKHNLLREGISEESIIVTGNTVIDALLKVVSKEFSFESTSLRNLPFENKRIILVTAHRRENLGRPLRKICSALREIAQSYNDVHIVYPVHLNPNVREVVYSALEGIEDISLIEPLDYQTFVHLMNRAYLILTDSGGLQEEAPSLGKPVLVLRDTTERPEAIETGTARLVGTNSLRIIMEVSKLLEDEIEYERMAQAINPYGDGRASERIVLSLIETRK